jgi:hypothetical protein
VHSEPLSFAEACLGNEDYLFLLERGLKHTHVTVKNLARDILDQAMRHPDELAQLSSALREEVKRLRQQAHSSEEDSGGSSSHDDLDLSGQYIPCTAPTFPKSSPKIPETVRTVQNKVYKVPTYSTGSTGRPPRDSSEMPPCAPAALARFRQLAADQQDYLSGRLRALPVEQRQDVRRNGASVVRQARCAMPPPICSD